MLISFVPHTIIINPNRKHGKLTTTRQYVFPLIPKAKLTLLVKLSDLTQQQLSSLKKQLDEEIAHLTSSFQSLRSAQLRFRDCLKSLSSPLTATSSRPILVPLTTSLYVPGTLVDTEKVLVDVGTGFYVEKGRDEAKVFYEGKVEELGGSLGELEKIVGGKGENLRVVEEGELSLLLGDS